MSYDVLRWVRPAYEGIASPARPGSVDSLDATDVRNRLSQALEEVDPAASPLVGEPGSARRAKLVA